LLATVVLVGVLLTAVLDAEWPRDDGMVTLVDINTLGGALFRDWLLPFELVSVVLTVALIGAVVLSHRDEEEA
jgi:NADH-quinone oxidoreductase subunit J